MMNTIRRLLGLRPDGYSLVRGDASTAIRIRGDMIPKGTQVITHSGIHFVDSGQHDYDGFAVFVEGYATHAYASHGE